VTLRFLKGQEEKEALQYIDKAVESGKHATCQRSKCGSVIVSHGQIIGTGFNIPPLGLESQRRCTVDKNSYHRKVTDKTCCMHAEEHAIIEALKHHPDKIKGSRLYFIRLDEHNLPARAEKPYCTICSKMALVSGVKEFVLWHKEGVCVYDTEEYNTLSYQYEE
jgi:deoxycytidylate deaminase